MQIPLPYQLGDYRLEAKIGHGGMGAIYRATDMQGNTVAVKLLNIYQLERENREERIQRFEREAAVLQKFKSPYVVNFYHYGEYLAPQINLHVYYLVMEYIELSLAQKLESSGALKLDIALICLYQIAEGLREAHENGIIHRDVKPANILITADGFLKIIDFGVAKLKEQTSSKLTKTGMILGSVHYMAPELINSLSGIVPQSDIFSLGVMFYYMITGVLPFQGTMEDVLQGVLSHTPLPPSYRNPSLPDRIDEMAMKMLAKIPELRYDSIASLQPEILKNLLDCAKSSPEHFFKICNKYRGFNCGDLAIYAHAFNEERSILPLLLTLVRKGADLRQRKDGAKFLDLINYDIREADEDVRISYYLLTRQYEAVEGYDLDMVLNIAYDMVESMKTGEDPDLWQWLSQKARSVVQKSESPHLRQRCAKMLKFMEKENRELWEIWEKLHGVQKSEKLEALGKLLQHEKRQDAVALIGEMMVLRSYMECLAELPENLRPEAFELVRSILVSREIARKQIIFAFGDQVTKEAIANMVESVRNGDLEVYAGEEVGRLLSMAKTKGFKSTMSLINPDVERRNNLLKSREDFDYYLKIFGDKFNQVVFLETLGTRLDFSKIDFPSGDQNAFLREFCGNRLSSLCVSLNLSGKDIGDGGVEILVTSERLSRLTSLVLAGNSLTDKGAAAIARCKIFSGITHLDLSNNRITDKGAREIAQNKVFRLSNWNLSNNQISDRGVGIIARNKGMSGLTSLDLSNNRVGSIDRKPKFVLLDFRFVVCYCFDLIYRVLYFILGKLVKTRFSIGKLIYFLLKFVLHRLYAVDPRNGARRIGQSRTFARIESLNLGNNFLHDHGVEVIARSRALSGLKYLNLSHTRMTDIATLVICKSKALNKLKFLDLSRNPIGDAGASSLAKSVYLSELEKLNLCYTKISETGKGVFDTRRWQGIAEFDILQVKERHRITMNPQELGLTERIKKVLLEQ